MMGLTQKQAEMLRFIECYLEKNNGVSPSFDEMKDALGLASKNSVYHLVRCLEQRGHIVRLPDCARSIRVITSSAAKSISALVEELDDLGKGRVIDLIKTELRRVGALQPQHAGDA